MKINSEIKKLVENLDQKMSPSVYDTAWLLRYRSRNGGLESRQYLKWLLQSQYEDGSWGADIKFYHHDRIICTLMALIALVEQEQTEEITAAIKRGEYYLWHNAHLLYRDPAFTELVGFELLFPSLMQQARDAGLEVPYHNYGFGKLQNEKLKLIPPEMLFSRKLTTVHSIEFLGPDASAEQLHTAVFENGSLGNSPAATAYYRMICLEQGIEANPASSAYLERVTSKYFPTNYLYPFRNFEKLWVINNFALIFGPERLKTLAPEGFFDQLQASVEDDGIGLDDEFGISDADCTSVAYYLLGLIGRQPDPGSLLKYEVPGENFFRTYYFERNLSVSTNIHALEALRVMPQYPRREEILQNLKALLFRSRKFQLFWTDKWHASPYYATMHALIALIDDDPKHLDFCRDTIDWLIHAQRSDGSWGFFNNGTMEETAYALLALQRAYKYGYGKKDLLQRGCGYLADKLAENDSSQQYDELWLGKCLYAPYDIIHSAVLAALCHQHEHFGGVE